MKHEEIIKVVQAHIDGKPIQYMWHGDYGNKGWQDCKDDPLWSFGNLDYRIKPEPRKFIVYGDTLSEFYAYKIKHRDDAEIEEIKSDWTYTFEVTEDIK